MGRAPCCDKANVKKGPWSSEEDAKLKEYIDKYGTGGNWIALPQKVGLKRCGKSCRLRWLNYLRPNIKHGEFSDEEDRIICTLFANIGSRWSIIAAQLPGRTDNDIKNYWNTKLKKKLMGFANNNNINPNRNKFMINNNNPPLLPNYSHHETTHNYNSPSHHHHHQSLPTPSSSFHYNPNYDHYYQSNAVMKMMNNSTSFDSSTSSSHQTISFQSSHQEDYHILSGVKNYNFPVKSNNSGVMFGSASNEGSYCSTSSDGSCNYKTLIKQGNNNNNNSFVGLLNNINNYGVVGDIVDHHGYGNNFMWGQKSSGYFGDEDYNHHFSSSCDVEDVKQVISSNNVLVSNNYTSFFNVDESKTHESNNKVMYF